MADEVGSAAQQRVDIPKAQQPKPALRAAGIVLCLLGWVMSAVLVNVAQDNPLLSALCGGSDAGDGWNCRAVLASSKAGIPISATPGAPTITVAVLGMAYFSMLGLWYLFVGPATRSRILFHLVPLAIALAGAAASIYYVRVMAVELRQFYLGCFLVHAVNGLLVLVVLLSIPFRSRPGMLPHPSMRLGLATLLAGVLACTTQLSAAVTVVIGSQMKRIGDAYRAIVQDPEYILWSYERQPQVALPVRDDDVLIGDPAAPHTMVVFMDAQCARCREAHRLLDSIAAAHPGRVRVAAKHLPLDPACNSNPRWKAGGHPVACRMAHAIEAARALGGPAAAKRAIDLLYARQNQLESISLEVIALQLGLPVADFVATANDPNSTRVAEDIALAEQLGIADKGVPILYLDGRRLDGWTVEGAWNTLLGERPSRE